MKLKSNRLHLLEVGWEDVPDIHRLYSNEAVDQYNTLGIPKDIQETRDILRPSIEAQNAAKRNAFLWKIVIRETGEFIGVAGMTLSLNKFKLGEIYYKLLPGYWGHGYATEIAKTLISSGFNDFGLHKVEAGVATENIASIRVLEKSGMTREGLRRKILPIRGEWKDNYHYAIVEDDPRTY